MLKILDITSPDIANGLGVRVTVWVSGCGHKCPGCHNKWTWKHDQGREVDENFYTELYSIMEKEYINGITFSGGDPLYQDKEALSEMEEIITWVRINFPTKDIWLYTGFTLEELQEEKNADRWNVAKLCDVMVEGRFVIAKKDLMLAFRGSSNQRIIDVKKFLAKDRFFDISQKLDY